MLHKLETDVDMLGGAIEMVRRWGSDGATGSKQNAKRSQWAGRLEIDRTRQENNVGEPSYLGEVPRSRDRFKGGIAIRVLSGWLKRNGFESPSTEGQERIGGIGPVNHNPVWRSRGS